MCATVIVHVHVCTERITTACALRYDYNMTRCKFYMEIQFLIYGNISYEVIIPNVYTCSF